MTKDSSNGKNGFILAIIFLFIVIISILLGTLILTRKNNKVINEDGIFTENRYYYGTSIEKTFGEFPTYIMFDTTGHYSTITFGADSYGEVGAYKVKGSTITLTEEYSYISTTTLTVNKADDKSVSTGSIKNNSITINNYKFDKVTSEEYGEKAKGAFVYKDVKKAFDDKQSIVIPEDDLKIINGNYKDKYPNATYFNELTYFTYTGEGGAYNYFAFDKYGKYIYISTTEITTGHAGYYFMIDGKIYLEQIYVITNGAPYVDHDTYIVDNTNGFKYNGRSYISKNSDVIKTWNNGYYDIYPTMMTFDQVAEFNLENYKK